MVGMESRLVVENKHNIPKNKLTKIVLLVTNFDAPTGGIQRNTKLLISELIERNIEVVVCCRNYSGLSRSEKFEGWSIRRSPVVGNSLSINGVLYLIDSLFWLVLNRKQYQVVHCQQMFGSTMTAILAKAFTGRPVLTRITLSGSTGEASEIQKMPFSFFRLRIIKFVSKFVALTRAMKRELEEIGIPSQNISLIHNSTTIPLSVSYNSEDKQDCRNLLGFQDTKIAVFTGRLSEEKRIDSLLSAWSEVVKTFQNAQLLILGEGGTYRNVEAVLKKQVVDLGLEKNVVFLGYVSNPKDYLSASDIFILPSQAEGMSNSLVEAFACGCTIIASDIEANKEICIDKENSLLFEVGNDIQLAKLINVVFTDQSLADRLAINARQFAEKNLTSAVMAEKYILEYEKLSQG